MRCNSISFWWPLESKICWIEINWNIRQCHCNYISGGKAIWQGEPLVGGEMGIGNWEPTHLKVDVAPLRILARQGAKWLSGCSRVGVGCVIPCSCTSLISSNVCCISGEYPFVPPSGVRCGARGIAGTMDDGLHAGNNSPLQ